MKNYKIMKRLLVLTIAIILPSVISAATLSVSPSSQTINVGDTFSVAVNLDTQGKQIDGVDLRYLNYNPSILELEDANTSASGVQIVPGSLMPMTLANSANTTLGKITFSQVAAGGNKYIGSGTLATLTFKAVSLGVANITFNYTSGNTTDSNVASLGSDVLAAVINGSYTVNSPSASTPPPTTTTTNSGGGGGGGGSGNVSTVYTSPSVAYSITPSTSSTFGTLTGPFGPNISGTQVTLLQQLLVRDGVYPEAIVSGFYGPATQAATKRFQQKYSIEATGIAGPQTRAKLNELYGGVTVLTPVAEAQKQVLIQQIKVTLIDLIRQLIILLQAQLSQNQTSQ